MIPAQNIFPALLSLAGILVGMILARIAPEEIPQGKKYFHFLERVLFMSLSIISSFLLYGQHIVLFLLFIISVILVFIFTFSITNPLVLLVSYVFFFIPYFISGTSSALVPSLLFLYGFPVGTILLYERQKKRS